ncbi:hypothetical protein KNE206_67070 [Kitasatospora sp. NE20-6]|uniref:hypothetical protein n=1 Tax=Kitasatospora sp. NE20-6 TaxID=2859066 RepID=UPI0034DC49BC
MTAAPAGRRATAATAALVAALLLTGAGLLAAARHVDSRTAAARPLTDRAATAQVTAEIGQALTRAFSYSTDTLGSTPAATPADLDDGAAQQYTALVARLRDLAAGQHLTVIATVTRIGVDRLTADRADLLVLLDQRTARPGTEAVTTAAQLTVTARLRDGRWRITDLTAL